MLKYFDMVKDLINYEGNVHEPFMVKSVTKGIASNGNQYFSFTLQDSSGSIDAKMFSNTESLTTDMFPSGTIIMVTGSVAPFRGHSQIKITDLDIVDEKQVDLSKYIPDSPIKKEILIERLNENINEIKDEEIKKLTQSIIKDNFDKYTTYPAAVTIHHAFYSGLLYHSLSICSMAKKVVEEYPFLSKDYLIAGSLLHDIGKIVEFSSAINPSYTVEGNLIGHINIGYSILQKKGIELKISEEKLNVLSHIILSHHGKPEFGSSKVPQIMEAYVIHILDDLDSKMNLLENTLQTTEENNFSAKILAFDNVSFYKPSKLEKDNNDE